MVFMMKGKVLTQVVLLGSLEHLTFPTTFLIFFLSASAVALAKSKVIWPPYFRALSISKSSEILSVSLEVDTNNTLVPVSEFPIEKAKACVVASSNSGIINFFIVLSSVIQPGQVDSYRER